MKKYLLILLLLVVPTIGQEKSSLWTEEQLDEYVYYKKNLLPMFIVGSYRLGIIDNQDKNKTLFDSHFDINIEINGNISFRPDLYSAFLYIRTGGAFSFLDSPQLKFAFGFSSYVYNARDKQSKLGWSIMMGGGGVAHFDMENRDMDTGYEIFLRGQYNFHKYVGVIVGLSFEHFPDINEAGSSIPNIDDNTDIFTIGINVGLAF